MVIQVQGIRQVLTKNAPISLRQMWPTLAGALLVLGLLIDALLALLLRAAHREARATDNANQFTT